jgi:hypothetical protein
MSRFKRWSYFVCLGGFTYWGSDYLVQWIRPPHYVWISALTFLVPACVVATWACLAKEKCYEHASSLAPLMFRVEIIWAAGHRTMWTQLWTS